MLCVKIQIVKIMCTNDICVHINNFTGKISKGIKKKGVGEMKGVSKKVTRFNLTMMIMGAVLTCLMLFSNMTISHAKTDESEDDKVEYGGVYFKADYSDTLTPMKGDTFTIYYSIWNMEDSPQAEITVDAYDIAETPQKLEFPVGYPYKIDSILYTGSNGGIFSYVVSDTFNVFSEGNEDTVVIYIGIEKAQRAYKQFQKSVNVGIVTDKMLAESGGKTYEDFETEYKDIERERKSLQEVEAETNTGTTTNPQVTTELESDDVYTEEDDDSYEVEADEQSSVEDSTADVVSSADTQEAITTTNNDEKSSNVIWILCGCGLVLLIVIVVIVALSKSKKSNKQ